MVISALFFSSRFSHWFTSSSLSFPFHPLPSLPLSVHVLLLTSFSSISHSLSLTSSSYFLLSSSPPAGYCNCLTDFIMTPGQTFALISIPIINDDILELTEFFSANLSLVSPQTPRITVAPDVANITTAGPSVFLSAFVCMCMQYIRVG